MKRKILAVTLIIALACFKIQPLIAETVVSKKDIADIKKHINETLYIDNEVVNAVGLKTVISDSYICYEKTDGTSMMVIMPVTYNGSKYNIYCELPAKVYSGLYSLQEKLFDDMAYLGVTLDTTVGQLEEEERLEEIFQEQEDALHELWPENYVNDRPGTDEQEE